VKTFLTIICFLALNSFAVADAATRPDSETVERYKSMFDHIDSDGDGSLTQEEATTAGLTEDNFRQLDEDGNGELNREEFIVLANDPTAIKGFDPDAPYGSDAERDQADEIEVEAEANSRGQ